MGSGPRSTTSVQGQWPAWLSPYAQKYADVASGMIFGEGGLTMPEGLNQKVAGLTPDQQAALAGISGMTGDQSAAYRTLLGQAQDTAGGKYLDPSTNPWLQKTYDAAARSLTDQYTGSVAPGMTAAALRAGAYGSSADQEYQDRAKFGLGQNLGDLATSIYGGNYQQERQNQLATQQAMPGLLQASYSPYQAQLAAGGALQQQQQTEYDIATQNALRQQQFPQQQLDWLGQTLQTALGPAAAQQTFLRSHQGGFGGSLGK